MTDTATPETLPAVPLSELPEATKDYLISQHAATGLPIAEIVREILNRASATLAP
jgi:hypothetical protein